LSLIGRGSMVIAGIAAVFAANAARCEDLDAKKTGPQLFESTCSACHRGPQGLAKGQGASSLVGFLRQHYTTGPGPAGQLAAYLLANPGDGRSAKPTPAAVRPDAPIERQGPAAVPARETPDSDRASTRQSRRHPGAPAEPPAPPQSAESPAAGEPTAPKGRSQRAARKPTDAAQEPAPGRAETTPSRRQALPGDARTPAATEAAATPAVEPPVTPATASREGPPPASPTEGSGDQSAFSAPTP
jgi:hypothetical protein